MTAMENKETSAVAETCVLDSSSASSPSSSTTTSSSSSKSLVRFGTVEVFEFGMTLDVNPATAEGPSVCLETECQSALPAVSVDEFENARPFGFLDNVNLGSALFYMPDHARRGILLRAGFTERQMKKAGRESREERLARCVSSCESEEGLLSVSALRSAGFTDGEVASAVKRIRIAGGDSKTRSSPKKKKPAMLRLRSLAAKAGLRAFKLPSHGRGGCEGAPSRAA